MGCTSSKLDDLPAVALCRSRCQFLEEAIQQRFLLANAHVAYIHSLRQIGLSLHRFFDPDLDCSASLPSPAVLILPTQRKGDPVLTSPSPPSAHHSHSNSGSHLHFHSDSDSDDDDDDDELHSGNSSPLHSPSHGHYDYAGQETLDSFPGARMTMNFMKNQATPSVVYEQRPMSPETVHTGESSSSYYPYSNPNPNYYPSSYPYYGYPPYGSSSPPPPPAAADASSSKPPPPPPSPPRNSPWDFLNPFDGFDKYYSAYTPSRDSKEVREEEGIPDLEDEDYQQREVVKEVHGNQKFADQEKSGNDGVAFYQTRPILSAENGGVEYEVRSGSGANGKKPQEKANVSASKAGGGSPVVSEVMMNIRAHFEKASVSGNGVSKLLEVEKLPYHRKSSVYKVSSKMLHAITPSLVVVSSQPSTSKSTEPSSSGEKTGSVLVDFDKDVGMRSKSLSFTLQELDIWERKLYNEVKAEEKMRIIHERKCRRLKRLDERGAEAHKVDSTRTLIRSLSTKMRIAIQVVEKISVKINKLRDEDLWPQLNGLIQELVRMWKVMLECHQNQSQAMTQAKSLDAISSHKKLSDVHLEATMKLEMELIDWISGFSSWISTQKGFVRALNSWLLKCIHYEPEETPDGIAPFSPGRIGAPPVFVICNQWSQSMDRISEKEVVNAMRVFAESVLRLYEQHTVDLRQRTMANKDMDMKVKSLEKEEQKIQKAIQALDKQMVLVSGVGSGLTIPGHIVHQSDTTNIGSLQSGLKQIFETMERFAANFVQAYEELQTRSEEYKLARENAKIP